MLISGANMERLAAAGMRLEQELARPVGTFVQYLSSPGGARDLYDQHGEVGHRVDVLVNNAGMG